MSDRGAVRVVLGAFGIALALGAWQGAVASGVIDELDMPKASTVLSELWRLLGTHYFWSRVGETAAGAGLGLLIGSLLGIALGMAMGANQIVRHALRPTTEFLRPVPGIALLPLAIVIWGPVRSTDVFLVAFGCCFPMLIQTMNGIHAIDDVTLTTVRSLRLTTVQRLRWLFLPGALPYILTGLRIGVSIALIVAIGAEILGGTPGLGNEIRKSQTALDLPRMYSFILATGVMGLGATLLANRLELRLLRWRPARGG